jgi:hypothetical protein
MGALRRPDWTEPMGTGLWGLGYRLRDDRSLVLLSNEATLPNDDPDRLWPFIFTHDRRRDKAFEQFIASRANFSPFLEHQSLGKDDLLCAHERDLNELLDLLEIQPLPNGWEGGNGLTANGQARRGSRHPGPS